MVTKQKLGRPRKKNKKEFVTVNVSPSTKAKWAKLKQHEWQSFDSIMSIVADNELSRRKIEIKVDDAKA